MAGRQVSKSQGLPSTTRRLVDRVRAQIRAGGNGLLPYFEEWEREVRAAAQEGTGQALDEELPDDLLDVLVRLALTRIERKAIRARDRELVGREEELLVRLAEKTRDRERLIDVDRGVVLELDAPDPQPAPDPATVRAARLRRLGLRFFECAREGRPFPGRAVLEPDERRFVETLERFAAIAGQEAFRAAERALRDPHLAGDGGTATVLLLRQIALVAERAQAEPVRTKGGQR